jgi:hypothetical protein
MKGGNMADRNDWDRARDREQDIDRERGGQRLDPVRREAREYNRWENEGGRIETEREGRGNFPRYEDRMRDYPSDYRGERGEWSGAEGNADYGHRGDWGRQGSWGTYGNRPSFDRREEYGHRGRYPSGRGELESSQYGGMYIGEYGGRATGRNSGQHNQLGGMSGGYSSGGSGSSYGEGMSTGGYGGGMGSYSGGLGGYYEPGRHAGRGPKNWKRADERIREDINERLTEHSHIDATEIDVQVKNGEVTLSGSVEDRRVKRMVEDLVEGVSGVRDVHNQLRVGAAQEQGPEKVHAVGTEGQTRK